MKTSDLEKDYIYKINKKQRSLLRNLVIAQRKVRGKKKINKKNLPRTINLERPRLELPEWLIQSSFANSRPSRK